MDKINRALCGVDDNAEAIRALKSRLDGAESKLDECRIECAVGEYKAVNGKSCSVFGTYRIDGPTIFVVAPGDTAARDLYFADVKIYQSSCMLIYAAESGEGELRIYPNATSSRALIIGKATKIQ